MRIFGSALSFLENILGLASDPVKVVTDDTGILIPSPTFWDIFMNQRVAHYDPKTGRFI